MADSVRERALKELVTLFEAQQEGLPENDPYSHGWDVVQRQPLGDREKRKQYALAILDGQESKDPQIQTAHATLQVLLEFHHVAGVDCDPSEEANRILTDVQRRLRIDIYLNNTVLRVWETGNELDVDGYTDRQINGLVFVSILYKHSIHDPRKQIQ